MFSIIWSLGANVPDKFREKFDMQLKTKFAEVCQLSDFPDLYQIWDYQINPNKCIFENWSKKVKEFEYNPDEPYFNILVPTIDTEKYKNIQLHNI